MASDNSADRGASPSFCDALTVVVGWLIPGTGLLFVGRRFWGRAALFFLLVHATFLMGICLKGGVVWPVWHFRAEGWSAFNNLTFIFQLGAGIPALLSMVAHFAEWTSFAAREAHAHYELGSFYCLVAGSLNYFIVVQSLDLRKKMRSGALTRDDDAPQDSPATNQGAREG